MAYTILKGTMYSIPCSTYEIKASFSLPGCVTSELDVIREVIHPGIPERK